MVLCLLNVIQRVRRSNGGAVFDKTKMTRSALTEKKHVVPNCFLTVQIFVLLSVVL